jgi:hypothetical protein
MLKSWMHVLTIQSSLVAAVVIVAWVRSERLGEFIGWEAWDRDGRISMLDGVFSGGGQLALARMCDYHYGCYGNYAKPISRTTFTWRREFTPEPWLTSGSRPFDFRGNSVQHLRTVQRVTTGIAIPYWALAALTIALPAVLLVTRLTGTVRRVERAARGRCVDCGYDIRASGARCPECGHAIVRANTG